MSNFRFYLNSDTDVYGYTDEIRSNKRGYRFIILECIDEGPNTDILEETLQELLGDYGAVELTKLLEKI